MADGILTTLRKGFKTDSLDFLLDFERVKTYLETNPTKKTKRPLSANSLKTYFSAIHSTIKHDTRFASVVSNYGDEVSKYVRTAKPIAKPFVCWSCVEQVRDELLSEWEDDPSWEVYQDYLLLCLYSFLPPRRLDYAPLRFVKEAPKDSIENFCVLDGDTATFVLNTYPMAYKHGTQTFTAPPELVKVLSKWRTMNKTDWLLVKGKEKRPMTAQELGMDIKDIFVRKLNLPIGVNVLRKAYMNASLEESMSIE
jgi:hypothetical protein